MEAFEAISRFYRPMQPSVRRDSSEICYREMKPNKQIDKFIYCIWQLKTYKTLNSPFIYRVVSDGCIDIYFNHQQPSENFVMGFCRKYTEFPIGNSFDYIGIRFLPAAFPLLFGLGAHNLSNKSQELSLVLPEFARWIAYEIKPTQAFEDVFKLLVSRLYDIAINQDIEYDRRFFSSLKLIFERNGNLDTEKDLDTGLSARQLRRVFNYYIGTSAKAFSNVVRFQHILYAKPSNQTLKENKLYFDVGFFDQAHFIKNFKTFYGVTPSRAFR